MRTSSSHHKNRRPDKFAISFLKSVDTVLASAAPWGGSSRSREDFDSYQFDRTNGASSRAHWARRRGGGACRFILLRPLPSAIASSLKHSLQI